MRLREIWEAHRAKDITLDVLRLLSSNVEIGIHEALYALTDNDLTIIYVSYFLLTNFFRVARYDLAQNLVFVDNTELARRLVAAIESNVWYV